MALERSITSTSQPFSQLEVIRFPKGDWHTSLSLVELIGRPPTFFGYDSQVAASDATLVRLASPSLNASHRPALKSPAALRAE
jgi:hypothetical protein